MLNDPGDVCYYDGVNTVRIFFNKEKVKYTIINNDQGYTNSRFNWIGNRSCHRL